MTLVYINGNVDTRTIQITTIDESATIRVIPAGGQPFYVSMIVVDRVEVVADFYCNQTEESIESGLLLRSGATIEYHLLHGEDTKFGSKTFSVAYPARVAKLLRGE